MRAADLRARTVVAGASTRVNEKPLWFFGGASCRLRTTKRSTAPVRFSASSRFSEIERSTCGLVNVRGVPAKHTAVRFARAGNAHKRTSQRTSAFERTMRRCYCMYSCYCTGRILCDQPGFTKRATLVGRSAQTPTTTFETPETPQEEMAPTVTLGQ